MLADQYSAKEKTIGEIESSKYSQMFFLETPNRENSKQHFPDLELYYK